MYISKSRFINWTRCPMYFPMDLRYNPSDKDDIDEERERRKEMLEELAEGMASTSASSGSESDDETFDATPSPELEALLPYYNQVEDEALKVAKKYFHGTFTADCRDVHEQKLFEYESNGHIYRCYVDIYNENEEEINIIEVKATTNSKYLLKEKADGTKEGYYYQEKRGAEKHPMFVKDGNIWKLNTAGSKVSPQMEKNFEAKKKALLDRYNDFGKYPHDIAFQRYVIENALRKAGDTRRVNFYLAVLNSEYVYDGAVDTTNKRKYNEIDGQEIITFYDMNEISEDYQPTILKEIEALETNISSPHDINNTVNVGKWCAWGKNTECVFYEHCFKKLRDVPDTNKSNNYINFRGFKLGNIVDKYQLINEGYYKLEAVPECWLEKKNHKIQRYCYDNGKEYVDKAKMDYWFSKIEYPIYHFDFETFPCPMPRFKGENPYRQSPFEFSLHIERKPGVCDKEADNFIFLNQECYDDERLELVQAIISHFEFNEDGTLRGTMLAQNTTFEKDRLKELAKQFPEYADKLLAIRDKSMDLIHLLKTNEAFYSEDFAATSKIINYYHKDLSGSYSIKKTLPVLVPSLTYKGMDVGNGSQAYIAYINYDSKNPTVFDGKPMTTKARRRKALERYCQQDTWAMVEILRAVRKKI